ncbi:MAG TPA: CYTH domain-containing protein, partial [Candidatus Angelobacter sp.]|nr:CYTH domain-containing protein [Candidatus Angelobacter sp.]
MSHEIEIEFKNMLTKEEFNRLKKGLALKETDFVTQHNDYFDTTEASLKERQSALRIREKAGRFVLTLKQPHDTGLLETHQPLSIDQVNAFFSTNTLPVGDVVAQLLKMSIPVNSLIHLGRLTTSRAEWQQSG